MPLRLHYSEHLIHVSVRLYPSMTMHNSMQMHAALDADVVAWVHQGPTRRETDLTWRHTPTSNYLRNAAVLSEAPASEAMETTSKCNA